MLSYLPDAPSTLDCRLKWNSPNDAIFKIQGIIDISKEIAKLETKKGKAIEALKKIEADEGRPDYEAKASLDHRVRNQEKVRKIFFYLGRIFKF